MTKFGDPFLHNLFQANKAWKWSPECAKAFQAAKDKIISASVLTHYNLTLPITLAADASAYGGWVQLSPMCFLITLSIQ